MKPIKSPQTVIEALQLGIANGGSFPLENLEDLSHSSIHSAINSMSRYSWKTTGFFPRLLFTTKHTNEQCVNSVPTVARVTNSGVDICLYELFCVSPDQRNEETLKEFLRLFETFKHEALSNLDGHFAVLSYNPPIDANSCVRFVNVSAECEQKIREIIRQSKAIQQWITMLSEELHKLIGANSWNTFSVDCVLTMREVSKTLKQLEVESVY